MNTLSNHEFAEPAKRVRARVPRAIILALDPFGASVLETLRTEYRHQIDPRVLLLTRCLVSQGDDTYRPFPLHQEPVVGGSPAQPDQALGGALLTARSAIMDGQTQGQLTVLNYLVDAVVEVYLLAKPETPQDAERISRIARQVVWRLDINRRPIINAIANLSAFEGVAELDATDTVMLTNLRGALNNALARTGDEAIFDRYYVVTQETTGDTSIPASELVRRTAGFLSAHFLDGLRPTDRQLRGPMVGARSDRDPLVDRSMGQIDLFGYAELRFRGWQLVEYCASLQASLVLEAMRRGADIGKDVQPVKPETLLKGRDLPSTSQELHDHLERERRLSTGAPLGGKTPAALRAWRAEIDAQALHAEEQVVREGEQLREQIARVFRGTLDAQILGDQGVGGGLLDSAFNGTAQALKFQSAISQWCEECRAGLAGTKSKIDDQRSVDGDVPSDPDQLEAELGAIWHRLLHTLDASPPLPVALTRATWLVLVAVVAFFLVGGQAGMWLTTAIGAATPLWLALTYTLMRRQREHLIEEYCAAVESLAVRRGRSSVIRQLHTTLTALRQQFGSLLDDPIELWQAKLDLTWKQCRDRAQQIKGELLQWAGADGVLGSASVSFEANNLETYFRELSNWQTEELIRAFLKELRVAGADRWERLEPPALTGMLLDLCRARYEGALRTGRFSLERHLHEVQNNETEQLERILYALLDEALPLARVHQHVAAAQGMRSQYLIVNDPQNSIFNKIAGRLGLQLVGGARADQMICIRTEQSVPVPNLALLEVREPMGPEASSAAPSPDSPTASAAPSPVATHPPPSTPPPVAPLPPVPMPVIPGLVPTSSGPASIADSGQRTTGAAIPFPPYSDPEPGPLPQGPSSPTPATDPGPQTPGPVIPFPPVSDPEPDPPQAPAESTKGDADEPPQPLWWIGTS